MRLPKNILSDTYREPRLYLCQTNKERIGEIVVQNLEGIFKWNAYSEISFDIDRMYCDINTGELKVNPYYDKVEGLRLVEIEDFGFFQLQDPNVESDGIKETKNINAYSSEYDLSQRYLENLLINKGVAGSIDGVQLYDPSDTEHSLLHIIFAEKVPDWDFEVKDHTLASQRRFFEIERKSVYDFLMNDICATFKCVIVFDTLTNKIDIYPEETAGHETDVMISFDTLANKIKVKYSADDIKTVLTVTGADDLSIREINYSLPYITDLTYYHTIDWMGEHLYNSYSNYLRVLQECEEEYLAASKEVIKFRKIISDLKNHVGDNITRTKLGDFLVFLTDLYKTSTVNNDKLNTLDDDFSYLNQSAWSSFKTTIQSSNVGSQRSEDAINTILRLIWQDYGLNNLKIYEATYKEMQTAQASGGFSDPINSSDYYQYHATFMMLNSCQSVIAERNAAITSAQSELDYALDIIDRIAEKISMENNFTEDDRVRLAPFLREDEYNDDNFLITDVDTEDDIIETQNALLDAGFQELHKRSQPKLTFSTSIANIFALDEFAPIINQFQLGNIIKIKLRDDYIKKSRLMEVKINFSQLDDFDVTFGDLISIKAESDIHADLLSRAINAGKSVAKNSSKWQKGAEAIDKIQESISNGFLDTLSEIKSMDGQQAVSMDKYGIHLRQQLSNGEYAQEQGWILNNKFLYTTDNWKTTKSIFGTYRHNGEEKFGVLADSVVSGYIEGAEIQGGSLHIGDRGDGTYALVVTADGDVQINAWGGELSNQISTLQSLTYDVIISASTTPIFNENVQSTVLTCTIYKNNAIVTPTNTKYTWIRTSNDTTGDAAWNKAHKNLTTNTITVTSDDVTHSAQFACEVNIP